jgi:hypothetical protein
MFGVLKRLSGLRGERGAADPILTIAAIAVSGIVSASIVGAIILVINLGTDYMQEQAATTSYGQAQQAFTEDAQNSYNATFIGSTGVTFYEDSSNKSAVSSARGRAFKCRISEWKVTDLTLTNKVGYSNTATAVPCAGVKTDSAALFTVALKESITVPGRPAAAVFSMKNAAGAALKFNNAGAFIAQTAPVPAYWTDVEWKSAIPQTISFGSEVLLPLAGARDMNLNGRTWYGAENYVVSPRGMEGEPGTNTFTVPTVNNVSYANGTNGQTYGGRNESLVISWDKTVCGPYAVAYTVKWVSRSAGAPSYNQYIEPNYITRNSLELSRVPNGAIGDVTIVASCPVGINGTSAPYTKLGHETAVPAPVIKAITRPKPHIHTISWLPVSSLATKYTVQGREMTNPASAWGNNTIRPQSTPASPSTVLTQNVTWPATTTYGRSYQYQLKASVLSGGLDSAWSAPDKTFVPVPAPNKATAITPRPAALSSYDRVSPGCVAGTVSEYRSKQGLNDAPLGAYGAWGRSTVVSTGALEGYKVEVNVETRCSANSVSSPSTVINKKTWVTSVFRPSGLSISIPGEARTYSATKPACGPGVTRTEYRFGGITVDGQRTVGPGSWIANSNNGQRSGKFNAGQGRTVVASASAICRGLYADSAQVNVNTKAVYAITSAPTPFLVANFPSNFWFDARGGCPVGLNMQSYADWKYGSGASGAVGWGGPGGRPAAGSVVNGNTISYGAAARCISPYSGRIGPENRVSAYYGSTPSAPSVSVSRYSNAVGQRFNVTARSSACAANGMRTNWFLGTGQTFRGQNWARSSTITDYWNSPGYRTYSGWVQCIDSQGNGGNVSRSGSAGVNVYTPAPSAITGLKSSHMIPCRPNDTGTFSADWNDSAYASSYGFTYSFTNGRGSRVTSSGTVSQSKLVSRAAYGDWSPSGNQRITVWAIGPGGKSASSSSTSYQMTHC